MSKFKPGEQIVYDVGAGPEGPYTVISKKEGVKLYQKQFKVEILKSIYRVHGKKVKFLFILDQDGGVGWIPENEAHPASIYTVLFG